LRSVLINTDQIGATKSNSAAALLSVVLPGLVDATNPNALQPNEVERRYWNDIGNVRRHFFGALDTVPGFAKARAHGNREAMVQLWKEHVCSFESGTTGRAGQVAFFIEKAGVGGFLCDPHPAIGLGERGLLPLVKLLLPEMLGDELELPWFARSEGFWRNPINVRNAVLTALYVVPGFREAHVAGDIGTMCRRYRSHVINFPLEGKTLGGQKMFFERNGALETFGRGAKTLGLPDCSIHGVLRAVIPELCDTSDQEHIRLNEVAARFWTKESMRSETLRALYTIPGFQEAQSRGDIQTLASLYRTHVLQYRDSNGGDGGQSGFYRTIGRLWGGIVQARYHGHVSSGISADLINSVCSGLLDDSNPDAVRSYEITGRYWTDENRLLHLEKTLLLIPGWQEAVGRDDIAVLVRFYRSHVLNFFDANRDVAGQFGFFVSHRVPSVLYAGRGMQTSCSYVSLLQSLYPALVDSYNPDALHPQELEKRHLRSIESIRSGVIGALYKIPRFADAHRAGDVATMFALYRKEVVSHQSSEDRLGGQLTWFTEVARMGSIENGRSALRALGVPEADLQSVPAALIQIGCPEIADAVRTLQSERHLAFVRGGAL